MSSGTTQNTREIHFQSEHGNCPHHEAEPLLLIPPDPISNHNQVWLLRRNKHT